MNSSNPSQHISITGNNGGWKLRLPFYSRTLQVTTTVRPSQNGANVTYIAIESDPVDSDLDLGSKVLNSSIRSSSEAIPPNGNNRPQTVIPSGNTSSEAAPENNHNDVETVTPDIDDNSDGSFQVDGSSRKRKMKQPGIQAQAGEKRHRKATRKATRKAVQAAHQQIELEDIQNGNNGDDHESYSSNKKRCEEVLLSNDCGSEHSYHGSDSDGASDNHSASDNEDIAGTEKTPGNTKFIRSHGRKRKYQKFTADDVRCLIAVKERFHHKVPWTEIAERYNEQNPERTRDPSTLSRQWNYLAAQGQVQATSERAQDSIHDVDDAIDTTELQAITQESRPAARSPPTTQQSMYITTSQFTKDQDDYLRLAYGRRHPISNKTQIMEMFNKQFETSWTSHELEVRHRFLEATGTT